MAKPKPFTLGNFVEQEAKRRKLSIRKFADLIGVSHSTLGKHINNPDTRPDLELLEKLSDKTGASLETLILIASPKFATKSRLSPRVLLIAERLNELGEETQELLLAMTISQKGRRNPKKHLKKI